MSERRLHKVRTLDSEALDESVYSDWSTHNLFHFYSLWKSFWRSGKYDVYFTIEINDSHFRATIIGQETIGT